jgi:hypothetical protein
MAVVILAVLELAWHGGNTGLDLPAKNEKRIAKSQEPLKR